MISLTRVLVVDDEPSYRTSISRYLTNKAYQVSAAESAERAIELLRSNRFDLVITDLKMNKMSGLDLMDKMQEITPNTATIVMTAYASIDTAVEATKKGAFHYILKPFNIEDLFGLCQKAIENKRLKEENIYLKKQINKNSTNIIAQSDAMKHVSKLVEKASLCDSCVFISGESGTGKEFLARAIHCGSTRGKKTFTKVDTTQMSPENIEQDLFGFVKGAFPGAVSSKKGKIELSNQGTLFITEIADISLKMQNKILNFLETKTFYPIGFNKPLFSDVRIIVATKKSMEELLASVDFNKDLLQKLSVISIFLQTLRNRKQDIPGLVNYFINYYSTKNAKVPPKLSNEALDILLSYQWPGNIGELKRLVEQLVVLNDRNISEENIPDLYKNIKDSSFELNKVNFASAHRIIIPESGINLNQVVSGMEEDLIMQALDRTKWNKNKAAKLLRLNRTTLVEKLRKKGLISAKN
jgi:DNA-binding NtrC family response regulator